MITAPEILKAMGESKRLTSEVLALLEAGMWDEWDSGLGDGLVAGFGAEEIRIAAMTGAIIGEHGENNREGSDAED